MSACLEVKCLYLLESDLSNSKLMTLAASLTDEHTLCLLRTGNKNNIERKITAILQQQQHQTRKAAAIVGLRLQVHQNELSYRTIA